MKIIIPLLTLVILLGSLELFVRWKQLWLSPSDFSLNIFEKADITGVGYTFKPNLREKKPPFNFKTNSFGILSPIEPNTPTECFRVIVFGGSQTVGYGSGPEHAYPKKLENELSTLAQGTNHCFEVVNAAQIGHSTHNISNLLKHFSKIYKPDLIVLALNEFGFDDEAEVTSEGGLSFNPKHITRYLWLKDNFHFKSNQYDLSIPIQPQTIPKKKLSDVEKSLKEISHAYNLFSPRVKAFFNSSDKTNDCPASHCFSLMPHQLNPDGSFWMWPHYSSLYLAPSYQQRFYNSINSAIDWSTENKMQMIIFPLNIYVDRDRVKRTPSTQIYDLMELTGTPSPIFFKKFNLVWDPHLNKKGHAIIAQKLAPIVMSQLSSKKSSPQVHNARKYWDIYKKHLQHYKKLTFHFVDFATKQNIHQIVSGPKPGQHNDLYQTVVLLRQNQAKKLILSGDNQKGELQKVKIEISTNAKQDLIQQAVSKGRFTLEIPLEFQVNGLADVKVTCLSEECKGLRINRIEMTR